jgi:hypothetical protein
MLPIKHSISIRTKTITFLFFIAIQFGYAQTAFKNYLNTGIGLYSPIYNSSSFNDIGNSATLNLEAEITSHAALRFSIDNYRVPLLKEINFNNALVRANTKTNVASIGLDYGLYFTSNKWRFYGFAGASICFIDEPKFTISSASLLSIDSRNSTRLALRISPGIKYNFSDTFILFTEFQSLTVFYKSNNKKILSGVGLVLGIATRI